MAIPSAEEVYNAQGYSFWDGEVDISRTPSPGIPTKRMRTGLSDLSQDMQEEATWQDEYNNLMRVQQTPESLGYESVGSFKTLFSSSDSPHTQVITNGKKKMQTGCIPCLIKSIPCDPKNPECKRAMSDDWNLNYQEEGTSHDGVVATPNSMSLSVYQPDMKWRRSWRERHSLNFFVNFSAPQMAGFFDSSFWQRMVIQTSYHEPAILHAITAIGALHECIMQRSFADETRKARAVEFALNQCNKAISCLTSSQRTSTGLDFSRRSQKTPNSRLALTTCVLFTCFEAMQGRCDSAVNHALQGRRLLEATSRPHAITMSPAEEDDLDQMRPIVERLEVQATALLDKGRRTDGEAADRIPLLPEIECVFSLDHAHNTLHTALNSVMRFMQGFVPTAPPEQIATNMAEKYMRYVPWFAKWEAAFTAYLAGCREQLPNIDIKRAMVLKANHLVGTMLASVDQSAGPVAYDAYEAEFRAIVDLAREVLASFSCPPLPTLTGGSSGTPYLSFSLWVTDPLWMAISRCRNPGIRQAAFTLLSQNPRQEGIWHAGPQMSSSKYMRRVEAGPSLLKAKETVKGNHPPDANKNKRKYASSNMKRSGSEATSRTASPRNDASSGSYGYADAAATTNGRVRAEW
ncbi:uncharacterized protein LTR77_006258 [Saxophila tyrrhenica]|uniref:Uncharacterized protein n=1 Tax=Saxophila tyrrhenica TaxID=1690608 RepID=A0AAV9PAF0_9PEZI|nr:hypothetical protein LTR77_006258 [Saxophila tyrrhenica]